MSRLASCRSGIVFDLAPAPTSLSGRDKAHDACVVNGLYRPTDVKGLTNAAVAWMPRSGLTHSVEYAVVGCHKKERAAL